MKKLICLSLILIAVLSGYRGECQGVTKAAAVSEAAPIEAYYFHNTARCITCKTVEAEAKADLQSLYGTRVNFQSLNLEEESTKAIAKKLQVSGQTLLIIKGDKKVDLTNEGFLYARTNPKKFKALIKEKVDGLLE
ncbi:MAG: nitrophenyl compound nitroreductase subunit ArsF family protein [Candidatus Saccharibacteria bacterium]